MPLQLKPPRIPTGLGLGFGLGIAKSTSYIPPRPPEGPSCSRWLSCSCCRNSLSSQPTRSAYFSPNRSHNTIAKPNTKARTKPSTIDLPPLQPDNEPSLSPGTGTASGSAARLPLPPTLPYSPDSVPTKRHLQYLSLATVSSTPEDSWRTYLALHPSLRRYIPDDLFRSLLAHQLTSEHPKQRWIRSLALVKFAKRCGVNARDLGEDNLKESFKAGLVYVTRTVVSEIETYAGEVEALWEQIVDCREVPLDLRKGYLQFRIRRLGAGPNQRKMVKVQEVEEANQVLRDVVDRFGIEGLGREAGKIVSLYQGPDITTHVKSLELAAWCAERGKALPDDTMVVMLRLISIWEEEGLDSMNTLKSIVGGLPLSPSGAEFLDGMIADVRYRLRRPTERVIDSIADQDPVPAITRDTLEMLAVTNPHPDVRIALDALELLLQRKAEVELVVGGIAKRITRCHDTALVNRLTRLLLEHDVIPNLRDSTIHFLLQIIVSRIPDEDAYILARKVYPIARSRSFRWHNHTIWQSIFNHALERPRRQLHFASRLFADAQADGLRPNRDDYRTIIRAVAMSRSASRSILLERHITGFLELGSPVEPFVLALVQGLTSSKNANDASLALEMSRRILQDRPIPAAAAEMMISRLTNSPKINHLRQAVFLLDSSPTVHAFNQVMFSIVAHSRTDPTANQMSRIEALSHAVTIYKRMLDERINVNARTVSLLLRALVDSRHVKSALAVFDAAVDNAYTLKPNSVGRLMVRLILDERYDEAARVEDKWRSSTHVPTGRRYDRAIVGARVLLDTKLGKPVNLEEIAKKTGWSGTTSFLRFVESLKPRIAVAAAIEPEPESERGNEWQAIGLERDQYKNVEGAEMGSAGGYGHVDPTLE